jgi:hypothetical protein
VNSSHQGLREQSVSNRSAGLNRGPFAVDGSAPRPELGALLARCVMNAPTDTRGRAQPQPALTLLLYFAAVRSI